MKKRLAKKMKKREMAQSVMKNTVAHTAVQETMPEAVSVKTEAVQAATVTPEIVQMTTTAKAKTTPAKTAAVKTAAPKAAGKVNIFYQFRNHQMEQQDIIAMIKAQWKDQGNKVKDLKDLIVYLKPEEMKAYYIINDSVKGSVALCE